MANTIEQNVLTLNKQEIDCLFKILTDNIDILIKVIPGIPLLDYIATGTIANSNTLIIQAYDDWKTTKEQSCQA
jgi:hypothetical protein